MHLTSAEVTIGSAGATTAVAIAAIIVQRLTSRDSLRQQEISARNIWFRERRADLYVELLALASAMLTEARSRMAGEVPGPAEPVSSHLPSRVLALASDAIIDAYNAFAHNADEFDRAWVKSRDDVPDVLRVSRAELNRAFVALGESYEALTSAIRRDFS